MDFSNEEDIKVNSAPEGESVVAQSEAEFSEDDPIMIEGMEEPEDIDSTLKFHLAQFDGPLDLLYHLIKVAKIDIRDIFISQITEQYLEMMKEIDSIDMEKAADFTLMAATLLEIK